MRKLKRMIVAVITRLYESILRRRLRNHDFSIICSNCAGGAISHRLGKEFLSPTVNLWLHQRDFLKLAADLKNYMSYELEFVESEYDFPVAKLKDIFIYFNHSKTCEEAAADWNRRKERINYDNIFLLMYDREDLTEQELRQIEDIPCRGKVVFSDKDRPGLDYVVRLKPSGRHDGSQCMDRDRLGFFSFEKQFDFVKWLNQ